VCSYQATSSLDTETEQSVQDSIQSLNRRNHLGGGIEKTDSPRTVVIIAHRLSTVQNSDIIFVMEGGLVVEKGSHSELLCQPNGRYAELVMKMHQQ
jgi:ABC-type multidrug transport system fused ATPase/permease subunit